MTRGQTCYQVEHNELFASIRKGEPINDGVRLAAQHVGRHHGPDGRCLHGAGRDLGNGDEFEKSTSCRPRSYLGWTAHHSAQADAGTNEICVSA